MKQRNGAYCLAIGILVFADVCYATSNDYPMVSSILNEARALRVSGDVYKADALLTRAQRIAPRSADVYLEMAYVRKAQGDYTGLREVVDFGADIADGPPASIAQLRILRDKLTMLLPLDAETPFQLPPAVADKSESIDEKISTRSETFKPSLDNESEESLADPAADKDLVSDSGESAQMSQSKTRVSQAQPEEKPASVNVESTEVYQQPRLRKSQSEKTELRAASAVVQRSNGDIESSGAVTTVENIPVPSKAKEKRTYFVGVGILARPQSGSWISRGSIEREY